MTTGDVKDDADGHHPWAEFARLSDWELRWERLPSGIWGLTDFGQKTVTLTLGMTQAERRCTIAHETQHILRGPVPSAYQDREEVTVDRNAARLLLPDVRRVGSALAAAGDLQSAAEELWVDDLILRVRLECLHPSERGYLRARLAD